MDTGSLSRIAPEGKAVGSGAGGPVDGGEAVLRYRVEGMDCPSCAAKIETALNRIDGVTETQVNFAAAILTAQAADAQRHGPLIEAKLRSLGYRATPALAKPAQAQLSAQAAKSPAAAWSGHDHGHDHDDGHDHGHGHSHDHAAEIAGISTAPAQASASPAWWQHRKARLTFGLGLLLALAFATDRLWPELGNWPFVAAAVIGLVPFARQAFRLALSGSPFSIEMLMSVAAIGAIAINAAVEAAVVVFLFSLGEWLESLAASSARAGIRSLINLVPKTALLLIDGEQRSVPAESLKPGQQIMLRPGDRIPADGTVVAGSSTVDEAPVTGESMPVTKGAEDAVFAGTVNLSGVLTVNVTRNAEDNMIGRIIQMVEEAQGSKAPMARFIDRFSHYYTPAAMLAAALVILVPPLALGAEWSVWIYRGLSLLLIACPCALVLSTPAAIASGLAAGARRGLLIKGGAALEALSRLKTVAFDKTGTLTAGKPVVTDLRGFVGSENDMLALAAAVEAGSAHPIALAITAEAARRDLTIASASGGRAIAGKAVLAEVAGREITVGSPRYAMDSGALSPGQLRAVAALEETGKTVVAVLEGTETGRRVLGLIAVRDEARPDAAAAIRALQGFGIKSVMLTGDNSRTAKAIADTLGLQAAAELLPEDKLRAIADFKAAGPVAMIGDGINDAPALAAASVGIAMGGGTDVALETADGAILKSRVMGIAELVALSRATLGNIHQNIAFSLGLKGLFLVTSLIGTTPLWMAILADTGATVIVTLNALRLLRFRPKLQA